MYTSYKSGIVMDFKELIKYQFISQMGHGKQTNHNGNEMMYTILPMLFQFIMIAMMEYLTKVLPDVVAFTKQQATEYLNRKLQSTVQEAFKPKQTLRDTAVSLHERHFMNKLTMMRIFDTNDESSSSKGGKSNMTSEECNLIVDALLAEMTKLDNIPVFNLTDKGYVMVAYKDKPIQITRDIYVNIDDLQVSKTGAVLSIHLTLMSNTVTASQITEYVKDVYNRYVEDMKNSLGNKIYFFDQKSKNGNAPPPMKGDPESYNNYKRMLISTAPKQLSFTMTLFHSNKQFSNIFGDDVRLIQKRVEFFIQNKEWYDAKGIPYQLGIMLSGIPGSGKTSCIRAIANYTRRHIVNVNFANITTASQLKNLFYSDKLQVYDQSMTEDKCYFIPVDKRIYILEEIDAIGGIVHKRKNSGEGDRQPLHDELTLADILTVLDGTIEIPGRIVIMTTNHPEVLDDALIRPGRIDIIAQFKNATATMIAEMYEAYLDEPFPREHICQLPDEKLSAAEVGQVIFRYFGNHMEKKSKKSAQQFIVDIQQACHEKERNSLLYEPPQPVTTQSSIQLPQACHEKEQNSLLHESPKPVTTQSSIQLPQTMPFSTPIQKLMMNEVLIPNKSIDSTYTCKDEYQYMGFDSSASMFAPVF
jgi:SpoVK/Ycf46/Vps4 family AAA+-type ATPase